jgi:hypothetical protein
MKSERDGVRQWTVDGGRWAVAELRTRNPEPGTKDNRVARRADRCRVPTGRQREQSEGGGGVGRKKAQKAQEGCVLPVLTLDVITALR